MIDGRPLVGALCAALLVAACQSGSDLPEWSPSDHDNNEKPTRQVTGDVAPGSEDDTLVDVAWQQNCATCHGPAGRGDGPQSRMFRVSDLTNPDFQNNNSDEDIAAVIRKGRKDRKSVV